MRDLLGFIGGGAIVQLLILFVGQSINLKKQSEENKWKLFELQLIAISEYLGLVKNYIEISKIIMSRKHRLNELYENRDNIDSRVRSKENYTALYNSIDEYRIEISKSVDQLNSLFLNVQTQQYKVLLMFKGIEKFNTICDEIEKVSEMLAELSHDINDSKYIPEVYVEKGGAKYFKKNPDKKIVDLLEISIKELSEQSPDFTRKKTPLRYKWIIFVIIVIFISLLIGIF